MSERGLRAIHIGLGPIGRAVVQEAVASNVEPVAGVDTNPQLEGQDLGVIAGVGPLGASVIPRVEAAPPADVAIVCTGSSLTASAPLLIHLARMGLHVVSTCEELAYPWRLNPEVAQEIDGAAKGSGVAVVGTGVNPGFVLDTLILDVARACAGVEHVLARRRVDVATRRPQLQQKVGVGLTSAEFAGSAPALGHIGLTESLQMVVDGLGFADPVTTFAMEPLLAERNVQLGSTTVLRGRCLGMRQVATASSGGREVVRLELEMALGLKAAADEFHIKGRPTLDLIIRGGIAGDQATAALVVATAQTIGKAESGLRLMPELPLWAPRFQGSCGRRPGG